MIVNSLVSNHAGFIIVVVGSELCFWSDYCSNTIQILKYWTQIPDSYICILLNIKEQFYYYISVE